MLKVRRQKMLEDGRKVQLFYNEDEMREGMVVSLESVGTVRDLIYGLDYEEYANNQAIQDQCAMRYQIIGNQMGMLDDPLRFNSAMDTAYDARSVIAHAYGTKKFRKQEHWEYLHTDLDPIEEGCLLVLEMLDDGQIVISDNRKPKQHGILNRWRDRRKSAMR